jgi:S1/P1 Nuclease
MLKSLVLLGLLCGSSLYSQKAFSWGALGHRATGHIAEAMLTPQAKQGVSALLQGQRLADATTWADAMRGNPQYKHAAKYHYESMPNGVRFLDYLKAQPPETRALGSLIEAILAAEKTLLQRQASLADKAIALRFLVHFIGDLHQPLHTGRPEDRGGNDINVKWFNVQMNLHSVWDTGMILTAYADVFSKQSPQADQSLAYAQLIAKKMQGKVPPPNSSGQSEAWLYESLQLRPNAYDPQVNSNQLAYQNKNISIIDQRIYFASYRIAEVLNRTFANMPMPQPEALFLQKVEAILGDLLALITLGPRA